MSNIEIKNQTPPLEISLRKAYLNGVIAREVAALVDNQQTFFYGYNLDQDCEYLVQIKLAEEEINGEKFDLDVIRKHAYIGRHGKDITDFEIFTRRVCLAKPEEQDVDDIEDDDNIRQAECIINCLTKGAPVSDWLIRWKKNNGLVENKFLNQSDFEKALSSVKFYAKKFPLYTSLIIEEAIQMTQNSPNRCLIDDRLDKLLEEVFELQGPREVSLLKKFSPEKIELMFKQKKSELVKLENEYSKKVIQLKASGIPMTCLTLAFLIITGLQNHELIPYNNEVINNLTTAGFGLIVTTSILTVLNAFKYFKLETAIDHLQVDVKSLAEAKSK